MDGKSSVACYLMALDRCYASLCEKFERQRRRAASANGAGPSGRLAARCDAHLLQQPANI